MQDIARCIYVLKTKKVIAKTKSREYIPRFADVLEKEIDDVKRGQAFLQLSKER